MDENASLPVILVTDDDRSTRSLLRFALEEEGYRVILADDGEQCLAEIARSLPDMILIDAVMPGIDGFECCRRARNVLGAEDIPILIVTVLDDKESVDKAFAAGATDYITKPIHWGVLRQRAQRLLAAHRTLKEARQVAKWEALFRQLVRKENNQLDSPKEHLQTIMVMVQEALQADRVLIEKEGEIIAEAVDPELANGESADLKYLSLLSQEEGIIRVDDVASADLPPALKTSFNSAGVQALLRISIRVQGQIWGGLQAEQKTARSWLDVERFSDLADALGIVMGNSDL